MGKKSTRAVPRERIDYTQLLAELQAGSAAADSLVMSRRFVPAPNMP